MNLIKAQPIDSRKYSSPDWLVEVQEWLDEDDAVTEAEIIVFSGNPVEVVSRNVQGWKDYTAIIRHDVVHSNLSNDPDDEPCWGYALAIVEEDTEV